MQSCRSFRRPPCATASGNSPASAVLEAAACSYCAPAMRRSAFNPDSRALLREYPGLADDKAREQPARSPPESCGSVGYLQLLKASRPGGELELAAIWDIPNLVDAPRQCHRPHLPVSATFHSADSRDTRRSAASPRDSRHHRAARASSIRLEEARAENREAYSRRRVPPAVWTLVVSGLARVPSTKTAAILHSNNSSPSPEPPSARPPPGLHPSGRVRAGVQLLRRSTSLTTPPSRAPRRSPTVVQQGPPSCPTCPQAVICLA